MSPRRILITSYIAVLTVFLTGAGVWFMEAQREYRQLKVTEAANEQLLADAKRRLAEQQKILERMKNDPVYVEKVIRERLKLARPGEVVFRFED